MMSGIDSDEDEHPSLGLPTEGVLKTYTLYYTGRRMRFRIHTGGSKGSCVYHVSSTFTPGTPDVQLRAGDSDDGPVVAFGKFHSFSGNITIGTCDDPGTKPGSGVIHEQVMRESGPVRSKYMFETDASAGWGGLHKRRFAWGRMAGRRNLAEYACLDAATGQRVAYVVGAGRRSPNKVGRLCVTAQTSKRFDELLLVSWFAIHEKENRDACETSFKSDVESLGSHPRLSHRGNVVRV
ncbi:hypothetical protein NLG97_g5631 [Lecanicillium saksenae]|uniref:Uncharacterized protein n=1 Tax=Lecanicillium saksenae TaxID=468837 RepID=A0ACC1QTU3_9HYPO|nr:hypothetical protein NLG97_g5631 [Lecanicillium saksenae]